MSKIQKLFMISSMSLLVLTVSGCGLTDYFRKNTEKEVVEKPIEDQAGENIDGNKISTDSGGSAPIVDPTDPSKLHTDFPQDVYIVPDAQIISSMVNGESKSFSVSYITDVPITKIKATYKEELSKNNWLEDNNTETVSNEVQAVVYKKGNTKLTLLVGFSEDEKLAGKTYVQITGAVDKPENN